MFYLIKNIFVKKNNPGKLYDQLGSSYILGEDSLYFNFGYWPAKSYDQACQQLNFKLARMANIKPSDIVLNAGCGFGQEISDLKKEFGLNNLVGINLSDYQLNIANKRFKQEGIAFLKGSATTLPFMSNSFDKVMALESAMHFQRRHDFFQEAFRTLKPGGEIVMADMLLGPQKLSLYWKLWLKLASKSMHAPASNHYDLATYTQHMKNAGFSDIEHKDITNNVLFGILQFLRKKENYKTFNMSLTMKIVGLLSLRKNSPIRYMLIKGKKAPSL